MSEINNIQFKNYWTEHSSAEVQGAAVTCYVHTGRRHDEGRMDGGDDGREGGIEGGREGERDRGSDGSREWWIEGKGRAEWRTGVWEGRREGRR